MSFGRKQSQSDYKLNSGFERQSSQYDKLFDQYQRESDQKQRQIESLTKQLLAPPKVEQRNVESYQTQFYDRLKKAIDESSQQNVDNIKSDLSKRFGGAYNATFGNDLLSRVERERLNALQDAQTEANLYGQDLYRNNQQFRLSKLAALQGQYDNLSSRLQNTGSNRTALLREMQNYDLSKEQLDQQRQNRRASLFSGLGNALGGLFFGRRRA